MIHTSGYVVAFMNRGCWPSVLLNKVKNIWFFDGYFDLKTCQEV
jgi:hypothetical protein